MQEWSLAEAKDKFNELVKRALTNGPQKIQLPKDEVILISAREYEKLTGNPVGFTEFLMQAPDFSELDLERDPSPGRNIEL